MSQLAQHRPRIGGIYQSKQEKISMSTANSPRTKIRRIPENAVHDLATLHAIIDDAYLCHIAFNTDSGTHCLPMACWRIGEYLYIHGGNCQTSCRLNR